MDPLTGAGTPQICIFQNAGSTLSGTYGTPALNQSLIFGSTSVTASHTDSSNKIAFTRDYEASTLMNQVLANMTISKSSGARFGSSPQYLLVRTVPYLGGSFTSDCTGTQVGTVTTFASGALTPTPGDVYLVKIQPMGLTHTYITLIPVT
jgi:hypothetical protein